jgi:hypothetical protein
MFLTGFEGGFTILVYNASWHLNLWVDVFAI